MTDEMTGEEKLLLVRRVFHEGSSTPTPPETLEELYWPDVICHGPPGVQHAHDGPQPMETCVFADAFQDLAFTVEDVSISEERVVAHFSARGTQIAEFRGVQPSGAEVTATGLATFRIHDGKIAEGWGSLNWSR